MRSVFNYFGDLSEDYDFALTEKELSELTKGGEDDITVTAMFTLADFLKYERVMRYYVDFNKSTVCQVTLLLKEYLKFRGTIAMFRRENSLHSPLVPYSLTVSNSTDYDLENLPNHGAVAKLNSL